MLLKEIELKAEYRKVNPSVTAAEAVAIMVKDNAPLLLIEKGGPRDTHGVVTRRDIIGKLIAEGLDPKKVTVAELASKPLIAVNNMNLDIRWVAKKMAREDVSNVAIYDGGQFKGFVTDREILRHVAAHLHDSKSKGGK